MKVCYALGSLNRGGAEMLAFDVLNNYKTINGLQMELLYRKEGNFSSEIKTSDTSITKIAPRNKFDVYYLIKLRHYYKSHRFELIHVHQAIDLLFSFVATIGLKSKLVITHHGFSYKEKPKNWIRLAVKLADINIFVSKSSLKLYEDLLESKITNNPVVLYNGIDSKRIHSNIKTDIKKELGLANDVQLLGMTGNFYNDARDQLTICKAMQIVVGKNPNVHFVFIGDKSKKYPEYYDNCYKFCETSKILGNVHFVGKRDDVPGILKCLDYYVYSTNYETFGISVIEAMLCGLICVVNDIPPMLELTLNGKYGIIYSTGNENELAKIITGLLHVKPTYPGKDVIINYAKSTFLIESHLKELHSIYLNELKN